MSSILKVDQIQLADGSTPTAGDLGIVPFGQIDKWYLTSSQTLSSDVQGTLTNWSRASLQPVVGSGMSHSSGIFTFPEEGLYEVTATINVAQQANSVREVFVYYYVSTDSGSNYSVAAVNAAHCSYASNTWRNSFTVAQYLNVADASTYRIRFDFRPNDATGRVYGASGINNEAYTNVQFKRIADSQ